MVSGKEYTLVYDYEDRFVSSGQIVAYCSQLAEDFKPILIDRKGYGIQPFPPSYITYRLVIDRKRQKLCILYEIYWRKQECSWRELNKDHDHDYEQIQVHLNMKEGKIERVVVASVGPIEHAGHGVEVYSEISKVDVRNIKYCTSSKPLFPWGGQCGQNNVTQVREMPIEKLTFEGQRPLAVIANCYHAFVGLKGRAGSKETARLNPDIVKLDETLLMAWYYRNTNNRFGHDISKPLEEPHVMYYPPPEAISSRLVYGLLWLFNHIMTFLKRRNA